VTSSKQVAGATQQAAGETASTAKDEAAQVGQTATAAASDVAGTAKQEAGHVAGEAVNQARQLVDQARGQVSQQADQATQKLGDTLRSLSSEVRDLSQGKADGSGTVAGLAQQLAGKGEQLADYLAAQGPNGLVQDLRTFASRRPGTFLLGALAAGVATGRVAKGLSSASSSGSGTTPAPGTGGPAYTGTYETAVVAVPPVRGSYVGAAPVVATAETDVFDDRTDVIGPVSGDQRLMEERLAAAEPREPGTGLR
jgi:hypothetical protein